MPRIAFSYRRDDSKAATHMLFSRLQDEFGREAVFLDFDSIEPGVDFRSHIADALAHCELVLAMIGSRWRGPADGAQRIDDPADWVRIEIETALKNGVTIIPVLVDDTPMPPPGTLPESIRELAYLNAVRLDTGADFSLHSDRIVKIVDTRLPTLRQGAAHDRARPDAARPAWWRRRSVLAGIAVAITVAVVAAGLGLRGRASVAVPSNIASDRHDASWEASRGDEANKAEDYDTAFQWYRRAADKGSTHAKAQVGAYYRSGLGVEEDDQKAAQWIREAANEGDPKGMRLLAELYFFGIGMPRDNAQSAAWSRKAADLGDVVSEFDLGTAYMDGFGVPKDQAQALQWFTRAANHGEVDAMEQLGEYYDNGTGGLPKDARLARLWMTNAAHAGHPDAKAWLADHPA